ncbi:zinc finger, CCHC-type containing protein [Tanacetum coccineum]|uniref:Zinc finger, CCHC-type containing protein n=1 Tax=Tanacetum coccineum TaxID=301880 RepID=A0ABQ5ABG0_9ASTR
MDTLSLVSKYLNGIEDILDDGDSMEVRKLTVEKSKEEFELFEALDHRSVSVNEGSHRVVVFKKAHPRTYSKPFTRFSLPCDVDDQGAWDAELDMADPFNYMTEERFDQLGFVRVDYGKYRIKMVREVRVEIHGFTFLVDFVVIGYANEGEPSVIFGRDFLVTSKSRVDFGIGEIRIDLTMLEEMKDIDVMLDKLVENLEEELEESKPILEILENYMTYRKKLDEVLMGRARLSRDDYVEEVQMRIVKHGLPKKCVTRAVLHTGRQGTSFVVGAPIFENLWSGYRHGRGTLCINDGVIHHTYFPKPRAKAYLDNFAQEEEDDWLSCFEVRRDEDGNPKYGPVALSFLDIEDDMERALAMEAYFNPFKNIIIFKKLNDFLGDEAWHTKFEVTTPSGRKFNWMFKTKKTNRKLSRKFISEDILKFDQFLD